MRKRFIVELELPEEVTYEEARAYIDDAVATWRGSLCPDGGTDGSDPEIVGDPMWHLNGDSVKVLRYQRNRK